MTSKNLLTLWRLKKPDERASLIGEDEPDDSIHCNVNYTILIIFSLPLGVIDSCSELLTTTCPDDGDTRSSHTGRIATLDGVFEELKTLMNVKQPLSLHWVSKRQ